nr:phosphotransferase [Bittarella massiliensis (ex Durand et al. 2017)]
MGRSLLAVEEICGRGSVNRVFALCLAGGEKRLLRLRPGALKEYQKELWCLRAAGAAGLPVPRPLFCGEEGGLAYLVEQFVEGRPGTALSGEEALSLWRELGRFARALHQIPVQGFGLEWAGGSRFVDPFSPTLERQIAYNLSCLTGGDPLLSLGGYSPSLQGPIRRLWEGLEPRRIPLGLCHGDLSPRNLLCSAGGVTLVDFGCAAVHACPDYEVSSLESHSGGQWQAFLEGYGWSEARWAAHRPRYAALLLLRRADTLRWYLGTLPPGEVDRQDPRLQDHLAQLQAALETAAPYLA